MPHDLFRGPVQHQDEVDPADRLHHHLDHINPPPLIRNRGPRLPARQRPGRLHPGIACHEQAMLSHQPQDALLEVTARQALFSYVSPEARVPATHPLRAITARADAVLATLERTFDEMYSSTGRPPIPPERLLKSELLIALFSIRGPRRCCEELNSNLLCRWCLDMTLDEPGFDHSTFSQHRARLLRHEVAQRFFDAVVTAARREGLLSDEPFTVDGTLSAAWASLKSVTPQAAPAAAPPDDPGHPPVDCHGERRTNATHQRTTDPAARLARKGQGKEAQLCCSGHVLMENRHGLCVDLQIGTAERETALALLRRQASRGIRPRTLAADKGSHGCDFVHRLRRRRMRPRSGASRGAADSRARWPHHADRRLRPEPTASQTGGRELRLAQECGRLAQDPLPRSRTDAACRLARRRRLQPAPDPPPAGAGTGHLISPRGTGSVPRAATDQKTTARLLSDCQKLLAVERGGENLSRAC